MGIDCEWHAHLAECEFQPFVRLIADISVKHLYRAFIGKIDLSLVGHCGEHLSIHAQTRVTYFEATFTYCRFIFIFRPYCTMNLWQIAFHIRLCRIVCRSSKGTRHKHRRTEQRR